MTNTKDRRIADHQHLGPGDGGWLPTGAIVGYGPPTITGTTSTTGGGAGYLSDLGDVDLITTPPADLDVLTFDAVGGNWVPGSVALSSGLDDLSDVTITTPTTGDRLRFDGSVWVNSPAIWVPVMVEDGATGLWYVAVTGDGDAVMTEVS